VFRRVRAFNSKPLDAFTAGNMLAIDFDGLGGIEGNGMELALVGDHEQGLLAGHERSEGATLTHAGRDRLGKSKQRSGFNPVFNTEADMSIEEEELVDLIESMADKASLPLSSPQRPCLVVMDGLQALCEVAERVSFLVYLRNGCGHFPPHRLVNLDRGGWGTQIARLEDQNQLLQNETIRLIEQSRGADAGAGSSHDRCAVASASPPPLVDLHHDDDGGIGPGDIDLGASCVVCGVSLFT
jgi:hypothetical protein